MLTESQLTESGPCWNHTGLFATPPMWQVLGGAAEVGTHLGPSMCGCSSENHTHPCHGTPRLCSQVVAQDERRQVCTHSGTRVFRVILLMVAQNRRRAKCLGKHVVFHLCDDCYPIAQRKAMPLWLPGCTEGGGPCVGGHGQCDPSPRHSAHKHSVQRQKRDYRLIIDGVE